jgi:hypothetical protein
MYQLTDRDRATILAALRHWQATVNDGERDVFPHFAEDVEPLSDADIDALCELMNAEAVAFRQ